MSAYVLVSYLLTCIHTYREENEDKLAIQGSFFPILEMKQS